MTCLFLIPHDDCQCLACERRRLLALHWDRWLELLLDGQPGKAEVHRALAENLARAGQAGNERLPIAAYLERRAA